ncbi:MAG: hypothetical protein MUE36_01970 [Acidimicrobiales bacterium]|jgi:hypothetical protein|nr:hypothetical protein [Acidimicrobiales bacterium]
MSLLVVLAAVSSLVAVAALVWLVVRVRRDRAEHAARLPAGAETAILSIVEAVPDPRNHLALTRDLTGEVRIAGTPLDPHHHDLLDRAS